MIKELIDKEKKKVINKMNYRPKRVKITNKELKGIKFSFNNFIKSNLLLILLAPSHKGFLADNPLTSL